MKQQRGFTLVELIIVIVILGILAVTAAPRFFDFSDQARSSTIEGLKAAVQGGSEIGYARGALSGNAAYPVGEDLLTELNITAADIDDDAYTGQDEWVYSVGTATVGDENVLYITLRSVIAPADGADADDIIGTNCFLSYDATDAGNPPVIITTTSGC
ncbi:prepilin-type N-terminal cleavage/methylation domain-containing protein [Aliidiomarina indica]|uniref:prepilin-type N-terminal cleavage/methylation domain-containing protein n=1 Tax=Aliidiomarina indica TaxID=2749147 RepID=UPI00188F5552|nr:prepilin-type N-terminal cleavage/methylation domain-containing protein [Aliidiomarina indica]